MARSGRYSPLTVMITSCARGPDKRGAARRCSRRCSGREGGERWQCLWRRQRSTKGIKSKDNIMTHVRPRGEHSTPKVLYGVPETCWERGGTSQRPWWRVRTMAGAGTERRMQRSRARGQRWTHGLRGRVEREREQHLTCGKLRVDARPVYVMYGARREREEAGRCRA